MALLALEHKVLHGSGARMDILSEDQVDLVITSPPYFSEATGAKLHKPRSEQIQMREVENELYAFAGGLRPVFKEIYRVMKPGRALVIQSKDIRYGDCLIPLSDQHLSIAVSCGFQLVTRFNWVPFFSHIRRRPQFLTQKRVGQFKVEDGETFLVLAKSSALEARGKIADVAYELQDLAAPVWRMPFRRRKYDHIHVSPRPVIKTLIGLLSEINDLVVDPFAGYGTIIEQAKNLHRSALGWDIDADCVAEANRRLA